ncbi:MAG: glycosyl hydrolase [Phaeodactylibacter sp.]|uniref:glycoside hydrolase family 26 protein n=1 Tax=Phaeodactylibacter sp. TaxID=1940289 RepID=UPI0032EDB0EA
MKTKGQQRIIYFALSFYLPATLLLLVTSCAGVRGQHQEAGTEGPIINDMVAKIQTDVDPEYVYEYEQSKFVPEEGKSLLIMGQTVERITEYTKDFRSEPIPGGWAAYWGIPEFTGVTKAQKNETGSTQNHQFLVKKFPNTALQSALWMVGKWGVAEKTGKGEYDDVIIRYSAWAKSVNRPVYLRIGYEFDGPHNELDPEEYVKAYRHIVDLMRAERVENVALVWHSYAAPTYKGHPLSAWYPGDEYVDWVAISVFGHAYNGTDFGPDCNRVLELAKAHKKPVMIAESSPIKGITPDNTDAWDQWFVHFFSFIYRKNIKAISFINEDWTRLNIVGTSTWQDSRLQNNQQVTRAWFKETGKARYLKQSAELFKQLGFENNR